MALIATDDLTIIVKSSDGTPSQVSATDDLDCH